MPGVDDVLYEQNVLSVDAVSHVHEEAHRIGVLAFLGSVGRHCDELDPVRDFQPPCQITEEDERALEDADQHQHLGIGVGRIDFAGELVDTRLNLRLGQKSWGHIHVPDASRIRQPHADGCRCAGMKVRIIVLTLLLLAAGCSQGSRAGSCAEFAAEVDDLLAREVSASELEAFIQDSEERVAELMAAKPERAEPCVTAVMEAMFTIGFSELEILFEQ